MTRGPTTRRRFLRLGGATAAAVVAGRSGGDGDSGEIDWQVEVGSRDAAIQQGSQTAADGVVYGGSANGSVYATEEA